MKTPFEEISTATQGDTTGRVADELLRGTPERLVRGAQQWQARLQQAQLG